MPKKKYFHFELRLSEPTTSKYIYDGQAKATATGTCMCDVSPFSNTSHECGRISCYTSSRIFSQLKKHINGYVTNLSHSLTNLRWRKHIFDACGYCGIKRQSPYFATEQKHQESLPIYVDLQYILNNITYGQQASSSSTSQAMVRTAFKTIYINSDSNGQQKCDTWLTIGQKSK